MLDDDYNDHENFFTLKVKLLSDFTSLNNVQIVVSDISEELKSLEAGEAEDEQRAKKHSTDEQDDNKRPLSCYWCWCSRRP